MLIALVTVVEIAHFLTFESLVHDIQLGTAGVAEADGWDTLSATLQGLYLIVFIGCVIAYLAWLSRAVDNAPAIGAGAPEHSPRGAIGWWFVPFANLIVPYQIVTDLHHRLAVGDDVGRARGLLLGWWLVWLVSNWASWFALRIPTETVDDLRQLINVSIAVDILLVVAAALAILVVRRIQRREDARARLMAAPPEPIAAAV